MNKAFFYVLSIVKLYDVSCVAPARKLMTYLLVYMWQR